MPRSDRTTTDFTGNGRIVLENFVFVLYSDRGPDNKWMQHGAVSIYLIHKPVHATKVFDLNRIQQYEERRISQNISFTSQQNMRNKHSAPHARVTESTQETKRCLTSLSLDLGRGTGPAFSSARWCRKTPPSPSGAAMRRKQNLDYC